MAIRFKSRMIMDLPNLDFTSIMKDVASKIIIPDMRFGINRSIGIDNKPFPELEPVTVKQKAKRKAPRGGTQQLVDTGQLRDAFTHSKRKRNHVRIRIKGERSEISKYLQVDGVGKRKKKFNFFGVSQRAELQSISLMGSRLKRIIAGVNKRG